MKDIGEGSTASERKQIQKDKRLSWIRAEAEDRDLGSLLLLPQGKRHRLCKSEAGSRIFHVYRLIYSTLDIYKKGLLFWYVEHEDTETGVKQRVRLHNGSRAGMHSRMISLQSPASVNWRINGCALYKKREIGVSQATWSQYSLATAQDRIQEPLLWWNSPVSHSRAAASQIVSPQLAPPSPPPLLSLRPPLLSYFNYFLPVHLISLTVTQ